MAQVFISYSRRDKEFVRRLFDELKTRGREAWVDWQGIDYSTKWWEEICAGIEGADNFVLILSPDSLNSIYCHREIEHARKLNKRIIPFVYRTYDEKALIGSWYTLAEMRPYETLARENWVALKAIQYIDYPGKLNSEFERSLDALLKTVDTDPELVRLHTRLLLRIRDWEARGRSPSALLRGDELAAYDEWLKKTDEMDQEPRVTSDQRAYIAESHRVENEDMRLDAQRERRIRQFRRTAFVLGIVGAVALGTTLLAFNQAADARTRAVTATIAQGMALAAQATSAADIATATIAQGQALSNERTAISREVTANAQVTIANVALATVNTRAAIVATQVAIEEDRIQSLGYVEAARNALTNREPSAALTLLIAANQFENPPAAAQSALADNAFAPGARRRFSGHRDGVMSVAFSPDSKTALSGSRDNTLILWDVATGQPLRTFSGQSDGLGMTTVAFSPDGKTAVSGSLDGDIVQWDVATRQLLRTFSGSYNDVTSVVFSPDGKTVLAASNRSSPMLWEVVTGQLLRTFSGTTNGETSIAFNPDGETALSGSCTQRGCHSSVCRARSFYGMWRPECQSAPSPET